MKESKARRRAIPFGNQATVFGIRAKTIAAQIVFGGDYRIWLALIFGELADEVQDKRGIGDSGIADGKHTQSYKMTLSSPTLRVTCSRSRYSSRGIAYFRETPVKSLNLPTSIFGDLAFCSARSRRS